MTTFFSFCLLLLRRTLICSVLASPLCAQSEGAAGIAPPSAAREVFACRFGRSQYPDALAFQGGDPQKKIAFAWSFYVIRSGAEVTLIDAGLNDVGLAKKWGVTFERSPVDLLANLGIVPEAVGRIIITHLHFDHINGITSFPKARLVISRQERDDYVAKKPLGGMVYDEAVARILTDDARTHVIEKEEDLEGGLHFTVIGGHTAGSSVVSLMHEGRRYVWVGDECYLCANASQQRPIGRTVNLKRNTAFLATLADPAIVTLPCHDMELYSRFTPVNEQIVRIGGDAKADRVGK